MADAKEKKEEAEVVGLEIGGLIAILVVIAAWPYILEYLKTIFVGFGGPHALSIFELYYGYTIVVLKKISGIIIGISFPVSLFFVIAIVYCVEQLKHIRRKEEEKYDLKVEPAYEANVKGDNALAERWDHVKQLITSANPSDWRQAIMESDIVLEQVLTSLGYRGEGIGEKLKRVEPGDMKSLNEAWEAHKIRNAVAHEGSQYELDQYEAQRVINMYKKVFEEFYYV